MPASEPTEFILPYTGQATYTLSINDRHWELPLVRMDDSTYIAYLDSLGDATLIQESATMLSKYLADCDVLITSESKGIALTQELARLLGHKTYVVCRREVKASMIDPMVVRYKPITSKMETTLCMDSRFAGRIRDKKTGIVDDVVSTGATLEAMEKIVEMAGGTVAKRVAIVSEGIPHKNVVSLATLPIFKTA